MPQQVVVSNKNVVSVVDCGPIGPPGFPGTSTENDDAAAVLDEFPVCEVLALSNETSALLAGTAKVAWRAPWAFTLTMVRASLTAESSSGPTVIDVNLSGNTVLSSKLTIDTNEKTTVTSSAPAVISVANIPDDGELTFDVDYAGAGAKGAKVTLYGTRSLRVIEG